MDKYSDELKELMNEFWCEHLTDRCSARDHAKDLQLLDGEEVCKRICCVGCEDRCGYACGYADYHVTCLKQILKEMNGSGEDQMDLREMQV